MKKKLQKSEREISQKQIHSTPPSSSEKTSSSTRSERNRRTRSVLILLAAAAIIAVLVVWVRLPYNMKTTDPQTETCIVAFQKKAELLLKEADLKSLKIEKPESAAELDTVAVFFSLCDGMTRAHVVSGTGKSAEDAWGKAFSLALAFVKKTKFKTIWLKADVVCRIVPTTSAQHEYLFSLEKHRRYQRWGIAFDPKFQTALLEEELNGSNILDYDKKVISLANLNNYLTKRHQIGIANLPNEFYLFQCNGWICDENQNICRLWNKGQHYGRRIINPIDDQAARFLIERAGGWLARQVRNNGSFVYGYSPSIDSPLDEMYNIVRHAGSIWGLVRYCQTTGDRTIVPKIERALTFLYENAIVDPKKNTVFLIDPVSNDIPIGTMALTIITMTEYMEAFQTDKYKNSIIALGNGLLEMQDAQTGKFRHVLNKDLSTKTAFSTVFYDGETILALARLYSIDKNEKWLNAAKTAADIMIREDYTQFRDHWVAYAMNELTKYAPEERYLSFGLKNAAVNLKKIKDKPTAGHICLELLMQTFELYNRIKENNLQADYLSQFDLKSFLAVVYLQADRLFDGFCFPEIVMYMGSPYKYVNAIAVRQSDFRIRIDDIQHNLGGFYLYMKYYEKMKELGLLEAAKTIR